MSLSVGGKLGPYEILARIGAGGMGEVFRARDTKLDREVAVKILPDELARDPDRRARFEREAKVLAALNHPNIAQIYGIEDRALVMELVPGATLKGPLPLEEALRLAAQIADALSAAHEKGITHRDLKPGNIMVTPSGVVKVLDFGLALASRDDAPASENSPTLTMSPTRAGMIMGTAAYMSPEQARGKPVDKRADIWAFGVVLYEMLMGKQLFRGDTVSDVLAGVLAKDPDLGATPARVRRLLQGCLEKDPTKRLRDIGDYARLLEEPVVAEAARSRLWMAAAGAAVLIAGVTGYGWWRAARPVEQPLTQFSVDLGPDAVAGARITVAISRDGRRIVYPTKNGLATRTLDQATATLLSGTGGAEDPFFSPDGRWVAFFASGSLKKVEVQGGAPVTLCPATNDRGGSWSDDGSIIFTPDSALGVGLMRVAETGGTPQPLGKLGPGVTSNRWPQPLPGGAAVLFTSATQAGIYDTATIEVLSLQTGQQKTLVRGGYFGRYVFTAAGGYLVYIHEGTLYGVPFDRERLEVLGTAAPVLEGVASDAGTGGGQLDVSQTGALVYQSGKGSAGRTVAWLDSMGRTTPLLAKPGLYWTPRFSPDGKRLAYSLAAGSAAEVFTYDLERGIPIQLTFNSPGVFGLVWTPDGKHLVYGSNSSPSKLWWVRADGSGQAQSLLESKNSVLPHSFTPDGKRLVYTDNLIDILTLPLDLSDPDHPKPGKQEPFLTGGTAQTPAFSRDGRWMAYSSNESEGRFEIFVRPFPGPGGKWRISTEGGRYPVWSASGSALFFLGGDDRIMVSEYTVQGEAFNRQKPRLWSPSAVLRTNPFPNFDVHPDGKRVASFPGEETKGNVHATILLNFADGLRRRIPSR